MTESKSFNRVSTVILTLLVVLAMLPIVLIVIASFSAEDVLIRDGYTYFPAEWSLDSYYYMVKQGVVILRSYGVSFFVTFFGTALSVLLTTMLAYPMARKSFRGRNVLAFFVFFTMLFNGGMVPSYMVNTQLLGLRDSVWALIFPMSLNVFYVVVLRTFFRGIPMEIIEAAHIDGAGEFYAFLKVVLPLSKPGVATIGLFTVIAYWNDWFLGMLYIFDNKKYPVQTLLQSMQNSLEALNQSSANALEYAELAQNAPTDSGRMALTVLVVVPVMLAYPFFQKYFVKGLTVGGVKG